MPWLAIVSTDKHIVLVDPMSGARRSLTEPPAAVLWDEVESRRNSTWPVWSPTGDRLACFRLAPDPEAQVAPRLEVLELDAVRSQVALELPGRLPLYASWQPDGRGLAVLSQAPDGLELAAVRLDRPGSAHVIEEGGPVFFAWGPDGRRMFVHAGIQERGRRTRLSVRDAQGELDDEVFPTQPGRYCCPVVVGDRVVMAEAFEDRNRLVAWRRDGPTRALITYSGLGAFVPVPSAEAVLFAASGAPEAEGYAMTLLVPLDGGSPTVVSREPCLAFFWLEALGKALLVRPEDDNRVLAWYTVAPGGELEPVVRGVPTPELFFYLHYFEQFVASHPILDPAGLTLAFAGYAGSAPPSGPAGITLVDLARSRPPRRVADGTFATFPPRALPES